MKADAGERRVNVDGPEPTLDPPKKKIRPTCAWGLWKQRIKHAGKPLQQLSNGSAAGEKVQVSGQKPPRSMLAPREAPW
jgi:hypothetical protein